jgi:hypothetical protein
LPDIVSTPHDELNSALFPTGDEFYFCIWEPDGSYSLMVTVRDDGKWSPPRKASFAEQYSNVDPAVSPDGSRLFFVSNRPREEGSTTKDWNVWVVHREGVGWGPPIDVGEPVNTSGDEFFPSVAGDGTLYFTAKREGGLGERDIYRASLTDGRHNQVEHLPRPVNSEFDEGDVCVAPDSDYLTVKINGREDSFGRGDLYISFRLPDSSWSELRNMGDKVNTEHHEYSPSVSTDGKILFFTRVINGKSDIYWINAGFLTSLRPVDLQ